MKKLTYRVTVNAPAQQVWNTMLQPGTYKQWVAVSWPNSYYEGDWEKGQAVKFISPDGSGTKALIDAFEPHRFLSAKHVAVLQKGGVEDKESDVAKGWIGTTESYTFNESNGQTEVIVEINTNPAWEKMFNDGWPAALQKLKELSEAVPA